MAEAAFARTFLTSLDSRPIRVSPDHVEDARKYPARPPYILPRMPRPMSKPTRLAPGQERSITVTLKSLRNPPLSVRLSSQPLSTSVLEIKKQVSSQTRIPVEKMKVLHNKRPLQDSKILKELLGETESKVEFAVMVMGGAAAIEPEALGSAASESAGAALDTQEFWKDLRGFLMQRLKDEARADELSLLFKSSWESSRMKQ